jgi:hypothetical protein
VNEFSEFKIRLAQIRRKKPYLDYHKQEQNVISFEQKTAAQRVINLGDVVYLSLADKAFSKGYDVQAGAMYLVHKILAAKDPVKYGLIHLNGDAVEGTFYLQQLIKCPIKIDENTFYIIKPQEKFKTRWVRGEKQIYVQYLFYPANQGVTYQRRHN